MRKIPLLLMIAILLAVPVMASDATCNELCKSKGYEVGVCGAEGCGRQGWVVGSQGKCGFLTLFGDCCCSNPEEDLTARGMCRWLLHQEATGTDYSCDFTEEVANFYCEDGKSMIECNDCSPSFLIFGKKCEYDTPETRTVGDVPPEGVECDCIGDNSTGLCRSGERREEGNCVGEDGIQYWGYESTGGGAPLEKCNNNDQVDEGEECDGPDLDGMTCYDFDNMVGGTLACDEQCNFNTSACISAAGGGEITDKCNNAGETQCFGFTLKECRQVGEYLDWVTVEQQSEECCYDGDCSELRCNEHGGTWMPGGSSPDFQERGYCCGDDGDSDLGTSFANKLCVKDPGYTWVTGEEGGRYVDNRLLYCNGGFHICFNDDPYFTISREDHCENLCDFYCDPIAGNKWLPDTNPEVLDEPLSEGEQIDTISTSPVGHIGCCPAGWCWDGDVCIENQVDEPTNLYVYEHPSTQEPYRCNDGAWSPARLVYSWDNSVMGYCPNKDAQCLVGNESYDNNNNPDAYFSDDAPQCIGDGQYILDNYCKGYEWVSRTVMVGTKMLELGGATDTSHFKLYCDEYENVLNEFLYPVIGGKLVVDYLEANCELGGKDYPCVNNLCVLRNLDTDKVIFGASLNLDLFDPSFGFADVLGISQTDCSSEPVEGPWDYVQCGPDVVSNPVVNIVIFSDAGVSAVPIDTGWDMFINIIQNPIDAFAQLLLTGELQFFSTTGLPLRFDVLNSTQLFSKLYIARFDEGEVVQGVFESNRFDWLDRRFKNYLMVQYSGFDEDVCERVNAYTSKYGRMNCELHDGDYVVADSREQPSFLMTRWQDLTSKFKPLP